MRIYIIIIFIFLLQIQHLNAQEDGLMIKEFKEKVSFSFDLEDNLILIPITINGVDLRFILDTGVSETLLFSSSLPQDIPLNEVETINLKGLGSNDFTLGLKSKGNHLSILDIAEDLNHTIIVIPDENMNLSTQIGVPIHGIIGYQFFKNFVVEIHYAKEKITIYKNKFPDRKLKKYEVLPIEFYKNKPYITHFSYDGNQSDGKLLIDLGNAGALWLFNNNGETIQKPERLMKDYLGHGFSGEINGFRGFIKEFTIPNFRFKNVVTSFPDDDSVFNSLVENRLGSIGNEILRRFDCVYDYPNGKIYIKPNKSFDEPFTYNHSGIELIHDGMVWVEESIPLHSNSKSNESEITVNNGIKYAFTLKPVFKIANVRAESPAAKAGLQKNDKVLRINRKKAATSSLREMKSEFHKKAGTTIKILVERDSKKIWIKFILEDGF
uniref:PDZ domain-containing protein n=1 Tax=Flavobacterium sp. TaxID=239 RepID=UPI0040493882